jgi:hypothetical protein
MPDFLVRCDRAIVYLKAACVWPEGDHLLSNRLFMRSDGVWKVMAA